MTNKTDHSEMCVEDDAGQVSPAPSELVGHAIIAGFGVPGRAFAEWMTQRGLAFVVIEQNEIIVDRCGKTGVDIIGGDVRDPETLIRAGIEKASVLALAVPVESVVMEAIPVARKLNPKLRIIARVAYISSGLEAIRKGADETVVSEELAAREFIRLMDGGRATIRSAMDGTVKPTAHVSETSA